MSTRTHAKMQRCNCGGKSPGGDCDSCRRKRTALRHPAVRQGDRRTAPRQVHEVIRRPGRSLPEDVRIEAGRRLGFDFSNVRIHTDEAAARSASMINANAYAVGSHVVFGRGRYAPATQAGRRLLIHELVHVRQQHGSRVPSSLRIGASPALEDESRTQARSVMRGVPAVHTGAGFRHTPATVARDENTQERLFSEDCSRYLSAPGIDACEYYRCREGNMPDGCGPQGYYRGYGLKYCERFSRLLRPQLSPAGRDWLDRTRLCLMQHIERNIAFDAPCNDVKRSAFDSHPACYVRGGICMLPSDDWAKVVGVIDPADNDLKQVVITGVSCLANWGIAAFPVHSLSAGGGYGGLMDRDRRRAFGF